LKWLVEIAVSSFTIVYKESVKPKVVVIHAATKCPPLNARVVEEVDLGIMNIDVEIVGRCVET
jgi:hypothetical protein